MEQGAYLPTRRVTKRNTQCIHALFFLQNMTYLELHGS